MVAVCTSRPGTWVAMSRAAWEAGQSADAAWPLGSRALHPACFCTRFDTNESQATKQLRSCSVQRSCDAVATKVTGRSASSEASRSQGSGSMAPLRLDEATDDR